MLKNKYRFVYMILVGICITFLMKSAVYTIKAPHNPLFDFLVTICITLIIWEGSLWIDHFMNLKFPWFENTLKRILIHFPIALIYTGVTLYVMISAYDHWVCGQVAANGYIIRVSFTISLLLSGLLLSIEFSTQFFRGWKSSFIEMEKYKLESTQAQLENLKNQINPHFLFNNLSVLSSLVYKDQDKAVDFISQLSKVYRYVLENKNQELVRLKDEMTFLASYFYLLSIRFDKYIVFDVKIDEKMNERLLPPMSLQMLVENAIKHNEISEENPLTISIITSQENLVICNNLQERKLAEPSSKTGIKNIQARYAYFTDKPVVIESTNDVFCVHLPLISSK